MQIKAHHVAIEHRLQVRDAYTIQTPRNSGTRVQ